MTPEELAFFTAAKPVMYRFWWDQNKMGAECPYSGCHGRPYEPVPDDGVSYGHSVDCKLKDAILAYWRMQETKAHPGAFPVPPMIEDDE